uniref:Uncharacterized protein n=1 Tax=Parascaris univalens TaxID=6257 RepID=A0A915CEG1_PARUN
NTAYFAQYLPKPLFLPNYHRLSKSKRKESETTRIKDRFDKTPLKTTATEAYCRVLDVPPDISLKRQCETKYLLLCHIFNHKNFHVYDDNFLIPEIFYHITTPINDEQK